MSTRPDAAPPSVPEELSGPEAKLVYLYLRTADCPTVDELCRALGMPKLSLLPLLDALGERGLVDADDVDGWE